MPRRKRRRMPNDPEIFASVIRAFMNSPKFAGYAPGTQTNWSIQLELAERPETLGAFLVTEIRPALVQGFLDGIAHLPGKQMAALAALRQVEKFALKRDLLTGTITLGCEATKSDDGHLPWNEEQVEIGERYAGRGFSRVITLAANTGQRGSDLVRMAWTDLEDFDGHPGINVRGGQKKTGRLQWVPLTQPLIAAMATWERRPGPLLLNSVGRPWTRDCLSTQWAVERAANPALAPLRGVLHDGKEKDLVLHGLRGTACVRLLRAGCTTRQIADTVGMSEEMVKRYTRFSEQKANAMAAVIQLDRTARERARTKASVMGC